MKYIFTSAFLFLAVTAFAQDNKADSSLMAEYGFRNYNPSMGRYISVDPKASPQNNPYQYAENTQTEFDKLVKQLNSSFTMPEGFVEITPVKSKVLYQYAIKDPQTGFEVKYFLYPYNGDKQREKLAYNIFLSTIINAMGEKVQAPDIQIQSQEDIKKDFNADWGANAVFQPGGVFGKGFQFCSAQAIQKKGIGEVYIFWMFTDVESQESLMKKSFLALKFD